MHKHGKLLEIVDEVSLGLVQGDCMLARIRPPLSRNTSVAKAHAKWPALLTHPDPIFVLLLFARNAWARSMSQNGRSPESTVRAWQYAERRLRCVVKTKEGEKTHEANDWPVCDCWCIVQAAVQCNAAKT